MERPTRWLLSTGSAAGGRLRSSSCRILRNSRYSDAVAHVVDTGENVGCGDEATALVFDKNSRLEQGGDVGAIGPADAVRADRLPSGAVNDAGAGGGEYPLIGACSRVPPDLHLGVAVPVVAG